MGRKKVIKPHGGILIDRVLKGSKRTQTIQKAKKYYHIKLSHEHIQEVTNIATGVFSPLKGFLTKTELKSVLNRKRLPAGRHGLPNGTPWTIPIVLDIPQWVSSDIRRHKHLTLVDEKDKTIAVMTIKDIYRYDKRDFAKKVYGTLDAAHPGVAKVMSMGDYLIGGSIQLVNMPDYVFKKYTLTPLQTREKFKKLGWSRVVAFQTRNVPHAGHEYIQKTALSYVNGLFINPVIGRKKKGDFNDRVILDAYQALIKNYYSKDEVFLSVLQMQMRYAGPREAIHHAVIRKNFGCTHIIIGRDHAGVGDFYRPFAAHKIFNEFPDLEIQPIFFKSFYECKKCGGVVSDRTCPHKGKDIVHFSGTKMRNFLKAGKVPSAKLMRPEVAQKILKHKHPFVE